MKHTSTINISTAMKVVLISVMAFLFFTMLYVFWVFPAQKTCTIIDIDDLPLGEWKWIDRLFPFNPESCRIEIREEIINGKSEKYIHAELASDDSKEYMGFGVFGSFSAPISADIRMVLRAKGFAPMIEFHIIDGSPGRIRADGGELYSYSHWKPQPGGEWQTLVIPLMNYVRSSYQNPESPKDYRFDTEGMSNIEFGLPPGSRISIDVKEIEFVWGIPRLELTIGIIWVLILGVMLLLRNSSLNVYLLGNERMISSVLTARIVYTLASIALAFSIFSINEQAMGIEDVLLFAIIYIIAFADDFLKKIQQFKLWSSRYVLVFTIFIIIHPGLGLISFFLFILLSHVPTFQHRKRLLFFGIPLIIALGLLVKHLLFSAPLDFNSFLLLGLGTLVSAFLFEILHDWERRLETQKATTLYNAIFTNSSDAIFMMDKKGNIINYNKGFEHILGISDEVVNNRRLFDFIDPEDHNLLRIGDSITKDMKPRRFDLRFINRDNLVHTAQVSEQPIYNNTKLTGFLFIAADITQRKIMEAQLIEANEKLTHLAVRDGLTGIANRRHFDQILSEEWDLAVSEEYPICLFLCDIDYFKKYNDAYGHQMGDECLKLVAQTLENNISHPKGLVARYGGEEFVVLLPGVSCEKGKTIAEKLRRGVEELHVPHKESLVKSTVTTSIGVASIIPAKNSTSKELILQADDALYTAKRNGRNRVEPSFD